MYALTVWTIDGGPVGIGKAVENAELDAATVLLAAAVLDAAAVLLAAAELEAAACAATPTAKNERTASLAMLPDLRKSDENSMIHNKTKERVERKKIYQCTRSTRLKGA